MTTDLTTDLSGNTNPDKSTFKLKARNFILTVNEISICYIDNIIDYLKHYKAFQYIIVCEHIGQENKHYHIFIQYNQVVNLSSEYLYGCHLEKSFGTPQQNYNYVKAIDDKHTKLGITSKLIYEDGQLKKTGNYKTIKELKNATIDELEDLPIQYHRIANELIEKKNEEEELLKVLNEIENDNLKAPEIIYLTGPSGSGKTYSSYKLALKYYSKNEIGKININNNFFKIVNENAKCYIVEEFRASQLHASEFLQFIDKYGYSCNIKGSFKFIKPEMIIICSIINPHNLYKEEVNEQFIRRITKCYELDINHNLIEYDLNKDDDYQLSFPELEL